MDRRLRILALPVDKGGCGQYRVRQPMAMLKKYTDHDTYVSEKDEERLDEILKFLPTINVFVCRQGMLIGETKNKLNSILKEISEKTGKDYQLKAKWVMDIDDNIELISPYNEHYVTGGVEEYFDKNANKWLWKDGESGFNLNENRERLKNSIISLMEADLVTVTTKKLAKYALKYNKNVVVLPNSIDFNRWWKLPLKKNKQLRVGWSGGVSHYEDWYSIKESLNKMLRKYRFKLVLSGTVFKGIIDPDLQYLLEEHGEWVSWDGHSYRSMCMNLDLAIIPLADIPFNHYKSSLKFFEFSSIGVPCLVSNVEPYSNVLRNGDLAFKYDDSQSFEKTLTIALQSLDLRKKYANNAYNWVYKNRNAKINSKLWADAYEKLVYG